MDHVTVPLQPVAVNTAVPVVQHMTPATTVGGAGGGVVGQGCTVTDEEDELVHPSTVHVAV